MSTVACSNDDFFMSLRSEADAMPSKILDAVESITQPFPGQTSYWHNSSLLGFIGNLLEFFATQLFGSDIRIRKIWFRAAIEANKQNGGDGNLGCALTQTGRMILENYKDDLLLWVAYATMLFDEDHIQVRITHPISASLCYRNLSVCGWLC